MSSVETTRIIPQRDDGIRAVQSFPWGVTGAALTFIANPPQDMTSVEVDNLDGALPLRATLFGKNATGGDVIIGVEIVNAGGKSAEQFNETMKRNAADLSQTLDRVEFAVLKPDEATLAVAADVVAAWVVKIRFNNR